MARCGCSTRPLRHPEWILYLFLYCCNIALSCVTAVYAENKTVSFTLMLVGGALAMILSSVIDPTFQKKMKDVAAMTTEEKELAVNSWHNAPVAQIIWKLLTQTSAAVGTISALQTAGLGNDGLNQAITTQVLAIIKASLHGMTMLLDAVYTCGEAAEEEKKVEAAQQKQVVIEVFDAVKRDPQLLAEIFRAAGFQLPVAQPKVVDVEHKAIEPGGDQQ